MKLSIYSMKDIVADEFGPIWLAKNNKIALRNAVQQLSNIHPEVAKDYVLHHVGEWDTETGNIIAIMPVIVDTSKDEEDASK